MRQVEPDLWETEAYSLFQGLLTHAYLLTRPQGNVLFYNTSHLHEIEALAKHGGIAYQFLSHQDELGESLLTIRERYGAALGGHPQEREAFARVCPPDMLFRQREELLENIEVIPTPGHTPGSTCFVATSPHGRRYLFTGDTLFLGKHGDWRAGLLPKSDRDALAQSLAVLRELRPDVVISSAAPSGVGYVDIAPARWADCVDAALERMQPR